MRLGLGPRSSEINEQLVRVGESVVAVSRLVERRFREWPSGPSQEDVKELEHDADRRVSELLGMANVTFITPYDREDIVALAYALDDVADAGENASELLGLYGVETPTKQSLELCGLLVQASEHLSLLVAGLRTARGSADELRTVKEIEDRADEVARAARASLFKDDRIDPVIVIRWKDIYEALEEAIDACDTAANRVGNILVKNT